MIIPLGVDLWVEAILNTLRHTNTNIHPKQMRLFPIRLSSLNFYHLRDIALNKSVKKPSMLPETIGFQRFVHRGLHKIQSCSSFCQAFLLLCIHFAFTSRPMITQKLYLRNKRPPPMWTEA